MPRSSSAPRTPSRTPALGLGTLLAFGLLAVMAPHASAQYFNGVYSRDGVDVVAVADSGALYRSVSGARSGSGGNSGTRRCGA